MFLYFVYATHVFCENKQPERKFFQFNTTKYGRKIGSNNTLESDDNLDMFSVAL